MILKSSQFALQCMANADKSPHAPSPELMQHSAALVAVEYGHVLNALKHILSNIQEQSNIGDELCADLIHEVALPVIPEYLHKAFGYDN